MPEMSIASVISSMPAVMPRCRRRAHAGDVHPGRERVADAERAAEMRLSSSAEIWACRPSPSPGRWEPRWPADGDRAGARRDAAVEHEVGGGEREVVAPGVDGLTGRERERPGAVAVGVGVEDRGAGGVRHVRVERQPVVGVDGQGLARLRRLQDDLTVGVEAHRPGDEMLEPRMMSALS